MTEPCNDCNLKSTIIEVLHEKTLSLEDKVAALQQELVDEKIKVQTLKSERNQMKIKVDAVRRMGRSMHVTVDKVGDLLHPDSGHPKTRIYDVRMDYLDAAALILALKGVDIDEQESARY